MKKNIFVVLCTVISSLLVYQPGVVAQEQEQEEIVHEYVDTQNGNEEFDDFFGEYDEGEHQPERPKKEKWSKARIMMVRLGVAAVLGVQGFYAWLHSAWVYVTSWVTCEERKA